MSGLFFVQNELKDSSNALFTLFLVLLFYNAYFILSWIKIFIEVMIRLNKRLTEKSWLFRCFAKVEGYETNLKRERRRKRAEERERLKSNPILMRSEYLKKINAEHVDL